MITQNPNGSELKYPAKILKSAREVMCLRAFLFLIQSGWETAVFLSLRRRRGPFLATDSFFPLICTCSEWIRLLWLQLFSLEVKCLLFLTTGTFPVNEKDSCLKHVLLYLIACNYVSTHLFTMFTTSRLLSGCSVLLCMQLPFVFYAWKSS